MNSIVLRTVSAICVALTALGPAKAVRAQNDLLMMETTVSLAADRWYQLHYGDSLRTGFELPLAHVFARPDTEMPALGELLTVARWDPYLHFAWIYQPANSSERKVWREDIGDWGYGIDQFVVDTTAGWVQLPPGPYGPIGWARLLDYGETDGFQGSVGSIAGRLIDLDGVQAHVDGSGESRTVSGTMLIESIDDGTVTFRPEVPSDMPCSPEQELLPDPEVPHFRSPVSSFVTDDLRPKFALAYPKGC